jgi:hypothetical protein
VRLNGLLGGGNFGGDSDSDGDGDISRRTVIESRCERRVGRGEMEGRLEEDLLWTAPAISSVAGRLRSGRELRLACKEIFGCSWNKTRRRGMETRMNRITRHRGQENNGKNGRMDSED